MSGPFFTTPPGGGPSSVGPKAGWKNIADSSSPHEAIFTTAIGGAGGGGGGALPRPGKRLPGSCWIASGPGAIHPAFDLEAMR